jgi:hypothetical protein
VHGLTRTRDYKNFNGLDKNYFTWFSINMTSRLIISFTVPFPLSLLSYITTILILHTDGVKKILDNSKSNITKNSAKNPKTKGFEKLVQSISDTLFRNQCSLLESNPLKFVCISCGKQDQERKRPVCESGPVKVEGS